MVLRRPLTRLELGLAAALIGIALVVFADRALDVMELAERTAMEATLSNVTSAVNIRVAHALLRGEKVDWQKQNPFDVAGVAAPSENWTFDAEQMELVYRPSLRRHLHTDDPGSPLRFRLTARRTGMGYLLVPAAGFQWLVVEVLPAESVKGHCFS
jgi:hypothetical protein